MKVIRSEHISDEELVQQLAGGQRRALETLYDRYFDKLVWFARTFVHDVQIAEDHVQEVFIRIIEKPEAFDPSFRFSTWIFTLTANRCRNYLRDEKRRDELVQGIAPPDHAITRSRYDMNILRGHIRHFFQGLNEKQQVVFVLRFEHELPLKEIATLTDMPEGTVKSTLFNMLRKFSIFLTDNQYEHGME